MFGVVLMQRIGMESLAASSEWNPFLFACTVISPIRTDQPSRAPNANQPKQVAGYRIVYCPICALNWQVTTEVNKFFDLCAMQN